MKLIDKYILKELLPMFLFGIIAFTALILGVGALYQMIRMAIDYNASFLIVAQIFVLKLPEFISYTLPMSTLFSAILAFNRFSNDLEITALRSAGISFIRLLLPVTLFGIIVATLTLLLNDRITPAANVRFNILVEQLKKTALTDIKQEGIIIDQKDDSGHFKNIILASEVKGKNLRNVTYIEYKNGKPTRETHAAIALWEPTHWVFRDGYQILYDKRGEPSNIVKFPEMNIIFNQKLEDSTREKTRAGDYTYRELQERIRLLKKQKTTDITALRKLQVDFYSKLSIPFAGFAFALVAAPLGLKPVRASSSVGLGISVIIIFLYYFVSQLFRGLGQSLLDPALAAWLPNTILIATAAWFTIKANK